MRTLLLPALLLLLLGAPNCQAAKVQVGKFTFLLDSVLTLMKLLKDDGKDPSVDTKHLCDDSRLPNEFSPVCEEDDAPDIFVKLIEAASNMDECEICANPACPGC